MSGFLGLHPIYIRGQINGLYNIWALNETPDSHAFPRSKWHHLDNEHGPHGHDHEAEKEGPGQGLPWTAPKNKFYTILQQLPGRKQVAIMITNFLGSHLACSVVASS